MRQASRGTQRATMVKEDTISGENPLKINKSKPPGKTRNPSWPQLSRPWVSPSHLAEVHPIAGAVQTIKTKQKTPKIRSRGKRRGLTVETYSQSSEQSRGYDSTVLLKWESKSERPETVTSPIDGKRRRVKRWNTLCIESSCLENHRVQ